MASIVIHACVAKEINKTLKIKNEEQFLLGSIAPDLGKMINIDRTITHFLKDSNKDSPIDLDKFLNKYGMHLNDPFVLGYYIHLYTDKIWENSFLDKYISDTKIKLLNGKIIPNTDENYKKVIYEDYNNLNNILVNLYHIDIDKLKESIENSNTIISEIDSKKLSPIFELVKKKNKYKKEMNVFNLNDILNFIGETSNKFLIDSKNLIK